MIYVNLYGRLGNNMFQMAVAATLAKKNNTTFLPVAEEKIWIELLAPFYNNVLRNMPEPQMHTGTHTSEYKEEDHFYHPVPFRDGMLMRGYFQSHKYFDEDYVKELFTPSEQIKQEILEKYPVLKEEGVTSINVRRGDYLQVIDTFPVCSMNYFKKAIQRIGSKGPFIVTSDDIAWCKANFKNCDGEFIFVEGQPAYVDFYIPTLCKNNIISNGTFSWWGAYLNPHPHKRVIKPKYWFHSYDRKRLSDKDMVLEHWEPVSNRMEFKYYKLFIKKYYKNRTKPWFKEIFKKKK